MNQTSLQCPVCEGNFGKCQSIPHSGDRIGFKCDGCGRFEITGTAFATWFPDGRNRMTPIQRSALSHTLRTHSSDSKPFVVAADWIKNFCKNPRLPSPATQATTLIEHIGDCLTTTGEGYSIDPVTDTPLVGAFNTAMFNDLVSELTQRGLISELQTVKAPHPEITNAVVTASLSGLTLDGWELYEKEKRGRFASDYGFIAMQFDDFELEGLVNEIIKPAVRERIGYDLVDMRNVARAGVIDNIMRNQIRDAAFVLADLTHDNPGAYWEGGYAEGLGKPVIYLCRKDKFDKQKPHFDTNHCTTVMWSSDDPEPFIDSLVATLRRSLNLSPS